ncbi:MAG TPA: hypothetical protein VMP67_08745 [Candidatus Limnocylindria bacterium]|nr:hypothetical protein [Candidatus Limnocylindria bacterium]
MRQGYQRSTVGGGLTILLVALLLGCGTTVPSGPVSFSIDYATGSIPPPYNHHYAIDVEFTDDGAQVTYQLEYRYRESLTEEELLEAGYGPDDDIRWSGTFPPAVAEEWLAVARSGTLTGSAEPAPGSDTLLVRVTHSDNLSRAGAPTEREPWEDIARQVDGTARRELGVERPSP